MEEWIHGITGIRRHAADRRAEVGHILACVLVRSVRAARERTSSPPVESSDSGDIALELREPRVIAGPVRTDGAGRCEFRFLVMRAIPAQRFFSVQAAQFRDTSIVVRQRVQE